MLCAICTICPTFMKSNPEAWGQYHKQLWALCQTVCAFCRIIWEAFCANNWHWAWNRLWNRPLNITSFVGNEEHAITVFLIFWVESKNAKNAITQNQCMHIIRQNVKQRILCFNSSKYFVELHQKITCSAPLWGLGPSAETRAPKRGALKFYLDNGFAFILSNPIFSFGIVPNIH